MKIERRGLVAAATGLLVGVIASCLLMYYHFGHIPYGPIKGRRVDIQADQTLRVEGLTCGVTGVENRKTVREGSAWVRKPKSAVIGYRCTVLNSTAQTVTYTLDVEFRDRNGFLLVSHRHGGKYAPLTAGAAVNVESSVEIPLDQFKTLSTCRLVPVASETEDKERRRVEEQRRQEMAAIQKENYLTAELARQRNENAQLVAALASATNQLRILQDNQAERRELARQQQAQAQALAKQKQEQQERALKNQEWQKWSGLKKGMDKPQVEKILGKPVSVDSIGTWSETWEYPKTKWGLLPPEVRFRDGRLESWRSPFN